MIAKIKKRDGRLEAFDKTKIKEAIFKAMASVGIGNDKLAEELTEDIVISLDEQETVETIQDKVVNRLQNSDLKEVFEAYVKYREDRTKAREDKTAILNTIETLIKEEESVGSAHKENANINAKTVSGAHYRIGSESSKDYNKRHIVPAEFVEAMEEGMLHIHDFDYYALSINCMQHDLAMMFKKGFSTGNAYISEPNSISSATALTCVVLQSGQTDLFGGESIPAWDHYMEPYVEKSFKKYFKKYLKRLGLTDVLVDQELSRNTFMEHTPVFEDDRVYKAYSWAKQDTISETDQACQALVFNLNSLACRAGGQVVFSSLNLGTCTKPGGRQAIKSLLKALDEGIGKNITSIYPITIFKLLSGINYEEGSPNYDLRLYAEKVTAKRQFPTYSNVDATYNKKFYKQGLPETEVAYMGCRTRVISNVNGPEIVTRRGNLSFTTINLPQLGIKASRIEGTTEQKEAELYDLLNIAMDKAYRQLTHRYNVQKNRRVYNFPYVMREGAYIGSEYLEPEDTIEKAIVNGSLTIGFVGLAECMKALYGKDHSESQEVHNKALKLIKYMNELCEQWTKDTHLNWGIMATPAESVAGALLRKDVEQFGIIPGVTDKEYYTNSFHVPVTKKITASEKIRIEGPFHELCPAGHISYIELEGDPTKNVEAIHILNNKMHDANMGYWGLNAKMDCCTSCGYVGIIDSDVCPCCGVIDSLNTPIRRPRRITGYLSYADRFNSAKAAELRDRTTHC